MKVRDTIEGSTPNLKPSFLLQMLCRSFTTVKKNSSLGYKTFALSYIKDSSKDKGDKLEGLTN